MPESYAEAADKIVDNPTPHPHYISILDFFEVKGALGLRDSWRERFAKKLALWVASALMRDFMLRRLFCLAIATELKRMNAWMDEPHPVPPNPNKK